MNKILVVCVAMIITLVLLSTSLIYVILEGSSTAPLNSKGSLFVTTSKGASPSSAPEVFTGQKSNKKSSGSSDSGDDSDKEDDSGEEIVLSFKASPLKEAIQLEYSSGASSPHFILIRSVNSSLIQSLSASQAEKISEGEINLSSQAELLKSFAGEKNKVYIYEDSEVEHGESYHYSLTVCAKDSCNIKKIFGVKLPATLKAGDHVATLELAAPNLEDFPLRGTIPIPAGVFTLDDEEEGNSPFAVELHSGEIVPAQIVGITRDSVDNYDVVEIIARVNKGGAQTGERIQYKVLLADSDQEEFPEEGLTITEAINGEESPISLPEESRKLFSEGQILARATDPFGNVYFADLMQQNHGTQKFFRYGGEAVQARTYNPLMPEAQTNNSLPHLMGVHAYFAAWKEESAVQLDLRISNGASGLRPDSPDNAALKKLYFESFEILIPADQELNFLWDYPAKGGNYLTTYNGKTYKVYEVIKKQPGGKMNFLPERAQVNYRLALASPEHKARARSLLEHENLAFSVAEESTTQGFGELWSWHNPETSNYFPSKIGLPTLGYLGVESVRGYLASEYSLNKNRFEKGQPGGLYNASSHLGWAFPIMGTYGGETGGTEINLVAGHTALMSASREGYLNILLTARGYSDRYSAFVFRGDGEHLRYEDAVVGTQFGETVPARFFSGFDYEAACPNSGVPNGKCDPFGYYEAPTFQIDYVENNNLVPDYEAQLLEYQNIDEQHLVRATKDARAAALQGNDALLLDEVAAHGELAHFIMSTKPMGFNSQGQPIYNPSGSIMTVSTDGEGARLGRGKYHPILNLLAYYNLIKDDDYREYIREEWFNRYLDIIEESQIECTGFISTMVTKDTDNKFYAVKSNEEGMHSNVLRAIRESVYKESDEERRERLEAVWQKHTDSFLIDMNNPSNSFSWSHQFKAPKTDIVVAPVNAPSQIACSLAQVPSAGLEYMVPGTPARFEPQFTFAYAKMETGNTKYDLALRNTVGKFGPSLLSDLMSQINHPSKVEGAGNQGVAALWCAQRGICQ